MIWVLFVAFFTVWLLGIVSDYSLGGYIHILLVLAVAALVFELVGTHRATQ